MIQSSQSQSIICLDPLDREIIELLKADGRSSFTEVAKRLKIPEATARYRVQKLLQSGAITVHAYPNPERLGTPHIMIVQLSVQNGLINSVAQTLAEFEEVQFIAVTSGHCNIVIDVYFGSHEELLAFYEKLSDIPGVIHHESQVVLKLLKAQYKYVLS
jgi:Lrp/AsnC family transcriptional regulator, regulator for asnA, asnC and gidA